MKQFESRDAASSVRVTLRETTKTERVLAVWVRDDFTPVAFADTAFLRNIEAESYEEFVNAVADMIRSYDKSRDWSGAENADEYACARLIIGCREPLPDLSGYPYVRKISDTEGHIILQFSSPDEARACAEDLAGRLPPGSYVEPDAPFFVTPLEGEECAESALDDTLSWGASVIHADQRAENLASRGILSAVTVAVVDSGVDDTHEFLAGRVVSGYDYVDYDNDPTDEYYHGTHVAGTVVDCTPGLYVNIMPVRVLDAAGGGNALSISMGIRYAADHGADVINLSVGGGLSSIIDEAVAYAIAKNIIVVAAAGNDKRDAGHDSPAHLAECITVSAVDKNLKPASFSNFGEGVDLAAPGVDIKSCVPGGGYRTKRGTSMAAPHVSACAAMLRSEFPALTPSQAHERLIGAAQRPLDWDETYGAGVVDMREASEQLYAILYKDGELEFRNSETPVPERDVERTYPVNASSVGGAEYVPWYDQRGQIEKVTFAEKIAPGSTALWFYDCFNLKTAQSLENLDVSGVASMSQMFALCGGLTELDLSGFDTGNVSDMSQMFLDCENLRILDLRGWNTGKLAAAQDMFSGCRELRKIYASDTFTADGVTDGENMFDDCVSLRGGKGTRYSQTYTDKSYARIDGGVARPGYFSGGEVTEASQTLYAVLYADGELSFQSDLTPQAGRTAQKVYETDSGGYQGGVYAAWYEERERILSVDFAAAVYPTSTALWFYGCKNLSEITNAENLHTDFVTDMSQMFSYCSSLTSLDLSDFVTDKVVNAVMMFYRCSNLVSIYASDTFHTEKLTDSRRMFYGCAALVGGAGTKYDGSYVDKEYARIDGGPSAPGYFTLK